MTRRWAGDDDAEVICEECGDDLAVEGLLYCLQCLYFRWYPKEEEA